MRPRPRPLVLALAATLAAALLSTAPPASAAHLLVPAYFPPEGAPEPWAAMCEPRDASSIAILNPRNGPVKRQAPGYLRAIGRCHEAGWRTIGYTHTKYGKRSLAAVEQAISHYYEWYPGIDGIFLDEMAETDTPKNEAYYASLRDYIRARGGLIVGNPGDTASTSWQLGYVDLLVTFEGSAAQFASYAPAPWIAAAGRERIADIVFAASGTTAMASACSQAAGQGAGFVYATDLPEAPNPYAQLPSYWQAEGETC